MNLNYHESERSIKNIKNHETNFNKGRFGK